MALIDPIMVFLIGLLLGATGIYIAAKFILGESDFKKAFRTALFGAVVWTVISFFFGWIPLLEPLITLVVWLALIKSRYDAGWEQTAGIALTAWASVLLILYLLAAFGFSSFEAVAVPGVKI